MARNYKYFILFFLISVIYTPILSLANGVEIEEKISHKITENIWLTDQSGTRIQFLDQVKRPTILTFVYFNCPSLCTPLMDELQSLIEHSQLNLGEDYDIFTISIDSRDSTTQAAEIKHNYLKISNKKKQTEKGWKFFTGDSTQIQSLTKSVGYSFKTVGDKYIHKACMIIIDGDGKIIRYNMGVNLLPSELKLTLLEASKGNVLPKIYKKDEYCYPDTAPAFKRLNSIAKPTGGIIALLALSLFIILISRPNKKQV